MRLEALAEVFNLTNRVNNLTRNVNFGPGVYPTNPVATSTKSPRWESRERGSSDSG